MPSPSLQLPDTGLRKLPFEREFPLLAIVFWLRVPKDENALRNKKISNREDKETVARF